MYTIEDPRPSPKEITMTSSNGNIFRVTGPLCGEFTGPGEVPAQRPVTRSFDVFFDLCPNTRLSKQPWGWWFETPLWSLWRQGNVEMKSLSTADEIIPSSQYNTNTYKMNPGYFFLATTVLKPQRILMCPHISARVWGHWWYSHTSEQGDSMSKPQ